MLDVAGGTGDIATRFLAAAGEARAVICDINGAMLEFGRDRAIDSGHLTGLNWIAGDAENLPVASSSVDVYTIAFGLRNVTRIDAALAEARRVLRPGGRFAVSDVVVTADVSPEVRRSMELWFGCIAGALHETDYLQKLTAAGFDHPTVERWRVYRPQDAAAFLSEAGLSEDAIRGAEGAFASAFIRSTASRRSPSATPTPQIC